MRLRSFMIILGILMLSIGPIYAQHKHKMNPYFRGRYKDIKVPKSKQKFICPGYTGGEYPFQGFGIKLGDPFALTYKFYATKRFSIVVDYGRTATGLYNEFHKNNFQEQLQPDTLLNGERIKYFGHAAKKDAILTGKVLYNSYFNKVPTMHWYLGVGAQFRWSNLDYAYIQETPGISELKKFSQEAVTFGPEVVAGIEYSHPDMPISSFFEVESYFDLANYLSWWRFSAGVGIRYIF